MPNECTRLQCYNVMAEIVRQMHEGAGWLDACTLGGTDFERRAVVNYFF